VKKIALINGPNLNLLGMREQNIYGSESLKNIEDKLKIDFEKRVILSCFQHNHEGAIIDHIQSLSNSNIDGLVINPAAYTHSSIAIRDALLAVKIPVVEVHISNIYKRESFRHSSYVSDIALCVISGAGALGYSFAIEFLLDYLKRK
jgi:3-dehydroquinate dehydratase-2